MNEYKKDQNPENTKVLVAMSGGVDSSVAAALLKSQGYQVIGVHMQLWDSGEKNVERFGGRCCSLTDANDARRVCDKLEIPYYVINAQDVFQEKVVDYFVHEYLQSRTPNPCAECNTSIKFSYLFNKADELGCDLVATGHYTQITRDPGTGLARLLKATDPQKDQSYFLFGLTQAALQRTLMPLGGLSKMIVRKLAEQFDLVTAKKADSQEICFIADEGYKQFIEDRTAPTLRPKGVIRTVDGREVGFHDGLHRYTIGQKKGLQLNNKANPNEEYFVLSFDRTNAALIVGPEKFLFHSELIASHINWISPMDGLRGLRCKAKIRSRHEEADCRVTTFENDTVHVEFDQPQRAITPGQAIVFYREDEVLGGGYIDRFVTAEVAPSETDKKKKPAATAAAQARA